MREMFRICLDCPRPQSIQNRGNASTQIPPSQGLRKPQHPVNQVPGLFPPYSNASTEYSTRGLVVLQQIHEPVNQETRTDEEKDAQLSYPALLLDRIPTSIRAGLFHCRLA